jgi:hypothetical protein
MLFAAAVAAANSTDHETSRTGGRAVHGIVPPAFEFRWAQYRVGLPREWRDGEVRHSHQTGRRDARRWPRSIEDDKSLTPSQGGEPERRRDERRTRRQAGASGNRAQGQCRRTRFSPSAREKGSENAPLAAAAAATATATGAAAASIGLREASRFEQGISPLASSVEMTWVEGRRTRDRPWPRSPETVNGHGRGGSAVPRLHVTPSELASRGVPSELGVAVTGTIVHPSHGFCFGATGSVSGSDRRSGSSQPRCRHSHGRVVGLTTATACPTCRP